LPFSNDIIFNDIKLKSGTIWAGIRHKNKICVLARVSFPAALLDFVLHLDHHMSGLIETHGSLTYVILWAIVFCETGLVLTPFLPGDSLLFAAGAFAGECVCQCWWMPVDACLR
jgi:hypothetical protein